MFNPMFLEDDMVGACRSLEQLTTGDWIALRRLASLQTLTDQQVSRLVLLGLAEQTLDGLACSRRGRDTLQSRP